MKLTYIEDTVLPSACYTPLCNLLLKSPDVKVKLSSSYSRIKERTQLYISSLRSYLGKCTQMYVNVFPFSTLHPSFLCLLQPISASAAHILGDICRERYEAVLPTVRLLLHHNRFVPFVSAVAALELENTQ